MKKGLNEGNRVKSVILIDHSGLVVKTCWEGEGKGVSGSRGADKKADFTPSPEIIGHEEGINVGVGPCGFH